MKYLFTILFLLSLNLSFAQNEYNNAHLVHSAIVEEGRTVDNVDLGSSTDLPIGIVKEIAGQQYIVGIEDLVLSPDSSFMSATAVLDVPGTDQSIAFSGTKVKINAGGIEGVSIARLHLASDLPIRISNKLKLTLKGTEKKTYVEFSCKGFEGMGVQGEFEFCRDFLIPEMPDGSEAPEPYRVKAQFETQMSSWGDMIAKVSITPFQVPTLKGFGFYVQDAYVDQSDVNNPLSLVFPRDYKSPQLEEGNANLWRGFFLKQLSVKLPNQFSDGKPRKEIQANNVLIDNMGFSGWITGKNIIPFEEGNMSGWPFSVEEISIGITCNRLTGAGFKGKINVPIAKEDTKLEYTAIIESGDNYFLSVRSTETIDVPLWGATMNLYPTTVFEIAYTDKKFRPRAILNGDISLTPDLGNGGDKGEFKGIIFENLIVQSAKPHILPGVFTIESRNNEMAGFSFTIKEIGIVRRTEEEVGFHLGLSIHLMNASDGGFSGETGITAFGKTETESGRQKWKYDHLELDRVKIDVSGAAYKIRGELNIYRKDATFGSGFRGYVNAEFDPGLKVSASAQFGNVNSFKYWYVDALLQIPGGTPIAPGFGLYGFGGGLYHHMKRSDLNNVVVDNAPVNGSVERPPTTVSQVENIQPPPSGVMYVPDEKTFLGLKATVIAGTYPRAQAFNADATFEIAFNNSKGVNYIAFNGTGYFMTSISDRKANVPVKADVSISMDFVNEVLHGNFDVYVNVAGAIKGANANNLAGGAVLHFDKSDWYINVGTPDTRLGLDFLGMFQARAYFMVGTNIPGMPPPPQNVSDILGGINLNFMRDENALGNGSGFCFGASLDVNTGKKQFLIFYGQFQAGMGFDIMLKNYGADVQCAGRGPLGLKGWYASGQAYGYFQGEVGIKADLVFVKGEFKILEIGAAAVLQAKLPNPTFLKGTVGGYYSILGGLLKGNCTFQVTVGEQCQIVGGASVVSGMKVIAEVSPKPGESEINVFNNPQAAMNLPIEKSFELEDLDGQVKAFRVKLAHFKLLNGSNELPGTLDWNESMGVVAFNSTDILPGKSTIKVSVKVYFEERIDGAWRPVMVDNKQVEEISEASFTTGTAPDNIPLSNVQYSYPIINQFNFLKAESPQGYIKLKKGQDDLFKADAQWLRKGRFIKQDDKSKIETDITYNSSDNTVSFSIPQTLQSDKIYEFELVNIPAGDNATVDANVKNTEKNLTDDGSAVITSKEIDGNYEALQEKVFYSASFRTSKFNTFIEKMSAIEKTEDWSFPVLEYLGVHELGSNFSGSEMFDKFDISGTMGMKPMIGYKALLNNSWYNNKMYPLLYKNYPLNGNIAVTWRNINDLGLPPVKAVLIRQSPDDKILTENEVSSNSPSPITPYSQIVYNLPFYMYKDYYELTQKAAAILTGNYRASGNLAYIVTTPFSAVTSGRYEVELSYVLPGTNQISSVYKITIKNP
ncbi:MAG: hypothetical protein K2X86_09965 [Cytophagaceae bacterium]|nr:hypothetical protein [Cytophagaceae bacterium]